MRPQVWPFRIVSLGNSEDVDFLAKIYSEIPTIRNHETDSVRHTFLNALYFPGMQVSGILNLFFSVAVTFITMFWFRPWYFKDTSAFSATSRYTLFEIGF